MRVFNTIARGLAAVSVCALALPSYAQTTTPNMIFTPVEPCRVFGGIAQTAGQTLNFQITGSANLGGQGGPSQGCGIPAYAKAVSMNLSATSSAAGKIIAFAKGSPRPNTVSLNYRPNETATTGTIVRLDDAGKASIYTSAASRTFGDVTGYFEPGMHAYIAANGSILRRSRVVSATKLGIGYYQVLFDRKLETCFVNASADIDAITVSARTVANAVNVYTYNKTGAANDYWFFITVHC
jgi:hypothetical protein